MDDGGDVTKIITVGAKELILDTKMGGEKTEKTTKLKKHLIKIYGWLCTTMVKT